MASTYSTHLRFELMATNEKLNTWGPIADTQFTLIDEALAGHTTVAMANGNYTLSTSNGTADESRSMFLLCTGTNTAIRTLNLPAYAKTYIIRNATTGGFAINITRGSSTITLANGDTVLVYCNGTVIYQIGYANSEIRGLFSSQEIDSPLVQASDEGDASAPTIGWSDDVNTGFFLAAPNELGVACEGVEVFRFRTGSMLVGQDEDINPDSNSRTGIALQPEGYIVASRDNGAAGYFKRSNSGSLVKFFRGENEIGDISVTGFAVAYNTTSDHRKKKHVATLDDVSNIIDGVRPVSFQWRVDNSHDIGFIAHELQEHLPGAVSGEKDGQDFQQVNMMKLIPVLVAEVKSLRQRVAELEKQVL